MSLRSRKIVFFLCLTMLMASASGSTRISERSRQKEQAETKRAALRAQLADLKREIHRTEVEKHHAADALAQSETAISNANRVLRELKQDQKDTEARLQALSKQHQELNQKIAVQHQQLGAMLRSQYMTGNEDRIKLLLSGDNPHRINRELFYMGYVSQAQARLLESLRSNLAAVENSEAELKQAKVELEEIAQEELAQKTLLEDEKAKHAQLLSSLSSKLAVQRKQAGSIERDQQRLTTLVGKLTALIEEQRKIEMARAEAEKKKQLARVKFTAKDKPATAKPNPDAIDPDENPAVSIARGELSREANVQTGGFDAALDAPFNNLRGKLRLPVKGELVAKYGNRRDDGPNWKGWFIRAAQGAEVKSVASGRVVFAEWLRGFGNLVIVDHGNQYMTIYGNNQAVLKQPGDVVKAGEIIASAGNSGGNEESGLYFEMRHQGRAFDPLGWIVTR